MRPICSGGITSIASRFAITNSLQSLCQLDNDCGSDLSEEFSVEDSVKVESGDEPFRISDDWPERWPVVASKWRCFIEVRRSQVLAPQVLAPVEVQQPSPRFRIRSVDVSWCQSRSDFNPSRGREFAAKYFRRQSTIEVLIA